VTAPIALQEKAAQAKNPIRHALERWGPVLHDSGQAQIAGDADLHRERDPALAAAPLGASAERDYR